MPNPSKLPLAWFFTFSRDLFCVAGRDGYFKTVNPAFIQLLGYSEAELLSAPCTSFIHPDDVAMTLKVARSIAQGQNGCGFEHRFRRKDGSYLRVAWIVVERGDHALFGIGRDGSLQQQIARATIAGQERERAQIGRELHDNINQMITTLKLYLEMARAKRDLCMDILDKCGSITTAVIEEIRVLSRQLLLPALEKGSLCMAIEELLATYRLTRQFKTRFSYSGDPDALPGDLPTCLYRIIQEGLNNVVRHAGATEVVIELKADEDVSLTIRDNGKGFDTTKRCLGVGLTNIISRADVYNGTVNVFSAPGKGCRLELHIRGVNRLLRETEVMVDD